ncbi:hypothetical protein GCM10020001_114180 [Nonomuraea salmonea]
MIFMSNDQLDVEPDPVPAAVPVAVPDPVPVAVPDPVPDAQPDVEPEAVADEGLLSEPAPDGAHEPL